MSVALQPNLGILIFRLVFRVPFGFEKQMCFAQTKNEGVVERNVFGFPKETRSKHINCEALNKTCTVCQFELLRKE